MSVYGFVDFPSLLCENPPKRPHLRANRGSLEYQPFPCLGYFEPTPNGSFSISG
jgi:hypothetical protein